MKKVGVLGGSFDPIHNGHLLLGQEVQDELDLDEVLFMPTFIQPFKLDKKPASGKDRLAMLELAVKDNDKFCTTTVELDRNEVSYTLQSLRLLQEQLGNNTEIIFIVGYDMFMSICKWWKAEELLKEYSFAVGIRSGTSEEKIKQFSKELKDKYGTKIILVHNRMFDVSSTEIKERINNNKSLRYLLPDAVIKYIYDKKLYDIE